MKKTNTAYCALAGLFCLLLAGQAVAAAPGGRSSRSSMIERGKYLVTVAGCNDCHSPKKMTAKGPVVDTERPLSGYQAGEQLPQVPAGLFGPDKWGALANSSLTGWVGPWGTSYASNLTPDKKTGTGAWNKELFIKILRTGKFMGTGRNILPPMPWYEFAKMTDADLGAVFAYLQSLKPVKNQVPVSVPALPPAP